MSKLKKKPQSKKQMIIGISISSVLLLLVIGVVVYHLAIPTYSYTIMDGTRIKNITSETPELEVILQESDIFLSKNDAYSVEKTPEGTLVNIQRAQCVTVVVREEPTSYYTLGGTVEEILRHNQIEFGDPWRVSAPLTEETYDGMIIYVDYIETTSESVVRPLKFGTLYCNDPSLPEGQTEMLFEGVDGEQESITTCTYVNGAQQSLGVTENIVLTPAMPRIVAVGTGENVGEVRKFPLFGDQAIITKDGQLLYYSHVDTYEATGYTAWIDDMTGTTACGTPARVGAVAVDPTIIPYFTKMYIVTEDGVYDYGISSAEDCGGAIKGKIIDLFFDTEAECWQFGRRNIKVYFLTEDLPA